MRRCFSCHNKAYVLVKKKCLRCVRRDESQKISWRRRKQGRRMP